MLSAIRVRGAAGWIRRRAIELADRPAVALRRTVAALRGEAGPARPLPPRRLRARTGAPGIREFVEGGQSAAVELERALTGAELPVLGDYASLLDFGCGSGRVLPHVQALAPGAQCAGCDVDEVAIAWAQRALPGLRFAVSRAEPPLPFTAGSFELLYSISVFSHLDEQLQDRWLAELQRMLSPGGVALLTVHGAHAHEQFRSGAVSTGWCPPEAFAGGPLGSDAFRFVPYTRSRWNKGELPGVGADYGLAFHGEGYLRRRWADFFEVVDITPHAIAGWQDVVVCRKRGGG
ncbi:MAG TPA: class I SAM-dependent methyltransferase [Solirubrobacteraceae bacterium]|jgi:SAM-dependent methyltransferase|nr:class I SAM-dependent methyltransferase [Solirubrobacteraceae bacterium]